MNEQQIIKQFAEQVCMEFNTNGVTVYRNNNRIYGNEIDGTSLERYLSISCTTVFRSTTQSCFVSHISVNNMLFVIILFSKCKTAFDGIESQYIIDELKKLKKKLGEIE